MNGWKATALVVIGFVLVTLIIPAACNVWERHQMKNQANKENMIFHRQVEEASCDQKIIRPDCMSANEWIEFTKNNHFLTENETIINCPECIHEDQKMKEERRRPVEVPRYDFGTVGGVDNFNGQLWAIEIKGLESCPDWTLVMWDDKRHGILSPAIYLRDELADQALEIFKKMFSTRSIPVELRIQPYKRGTEWKK